MIRLCSYNIHSGVNRAGICDLDAFRRFFDDNKVDIAIVQEVDTRASKNRHRDTLLKLAGENRPHHFLSPTLTERDGWYGNAIFSRYPIIRSMTHNLTVGKKLQPRNAADALIVTPEGNIRIIGTHLSLHGGERLSEVNNLISLMQEIDEHHRNPVIICGDFNEWLGRIKLLGKMNELFTPIPLGRSFPAAFPIFKLDRVWYEGDTIDVQAYIHSSKHTRYMSDHLPVLIDVEFIDPPSTTMHHDRKMAGQ